MALGRRLRQLLARREGLPVPAVSRGTRPNDVPLTSLESMFDYQAGLSGTVPRQRGGARRASA